MPLGALFLATMKKPPRGKKGGVESIVRAVTKDLVDAAEVIHNKGLAVWVSSTKK